MAKKMVAECFIQRTTNRASPGKVAVVFVIGIGCFFAYKHSTPKTLKNAPTR